MSARLAAAIIAFAAASAGAQRSADEVAIRAARTISNNAIAAHDTLAISRVWMPEYVSVSSTNAQSVTMTAARSRFAELIRTRPGVVFVRTPDSITVNTSWRQAGESGHWTGTWKQADSVTKVGGIYFAKWRKVSDRWLILAEVFVQTSCTGSTYCTNPP